MAPLSDLSLRLRLHSNLRLDARGREVLMESVTRLTCLRSLSLWCHPAHELLAPQWALPAMT